MVRPFRKREGALRDRKGIRFSNSRITNPPAHPAGTFEMRVYRDADYTSDVVAIVARVSHGAPRLRLEGGADSELEAAPRCVLLRVHDQCATSEIFGSLKCDCRLQLDASLRAMHAAAVAAYDSMDAAASDASRIIGVLVYLPQEGRGIGLAAKVAAYALQETQHGGDESESAASVAVAASPDAAAGAPRRGLDTVDANRALGLPDDSRHYGAVPRVLADLCLVSPAPAPPAAGGGWVLAAGVAPLALLTNSPRKADALAALGLPVSARLPCLVPVSSPLAVAYLRAKAERMGHDIPERFLLRWPPLPPPVAAGGGGGAAAAAAAEALPRAGGGEGT